jgi:hypothetical protein
VLGGGREQIRLAKATGLIWPQIALSEGEKKALRAALYKFCASTNSVNVSVISWPIKTNLANSPFRVNDEEDYY